MKNGNLITSNFFTNAFDFCKQSWESITHSSKERCRLYALQAEGAQKRLTQSALTKEETFFWKEERDSGLTGLANVHHTSIKVLACVAGGIGLGLALILKNQNN